MHVDFNIIFRLSSSISKSFDSLLELRTRRSVLLAFHYMLAMRASTIDARKLDVENSILGSV